MVEVLLSEGARGAAASRFRARPMTPTPSATEPPPTPPRPLAPGETASPTAPAAPATPALAGLVLPGPSARERVAGVAVGARAAILLRRAGCAKVVSPGAAETLGPRAGAIEPTDALPASGRALVVAGDLAFDKALLERLANAPEGTVSVARGPSGSGAPGFVAAVPVALARELVAAHARGGLEATGAALPADARSESPPGLLVAAATPADRSAATRAILRATGKAVDGPLTRLFERRISQGISRLFLPLPVSPNLMTTVSLGIGLTGAGLLATTETWTRVIGAATFVFATIVDGCDGEIARSKLLESEFGRLYDTAVDIVVNACVFLGIAVGVWREFQGVPEVWNATILLVAGGVLAMAAVESVRRLLPSPPPGSGVARVQEWAERFATLEWCYLVLGLSAIGQLPFFFWGAAIGANVFAVIYLVLGVLSWLRA